MIDSDNFLQPNAGILIFEPDNKAQARLMEALAPDNYAINVATTGSQALAIAALASPSLILLGSSLSNHESDDFCRQMRIDPLLQDVPIICVCKQNDANARIRALEVGADDIITEPLNTKETRARVRHIVRQNRPQKMAAQRLEFSQVQSEMEATLDAILEKWALSLEEAGIESVGHTRRVVDLTMKMATAMNLSDSELVETRRGAILHDIGRPACEHDDFLGLEHAPAHIQRLIKKHPQRAEEMLWPIPLLRPALTIPLHHHEHWDGTGYPNQLRGEAIPLTARIFAVVDAWDELRAGHDKRPPWPQERILTFIRSQAGKRFDPSMVELFCKIIDELSLPELPAVPLRGQKTKRVRPPDAHTRGQALSLARRGAWAQLGVAAILITVLPMLALVWLWQEDLKTGGIAATVAAGVCVAMLAIMISGYVLLGKYPLNIVRLRNYLRALADGEMPVKVHLSKDTDDLTAMQQYMADIVKQAAERIRLLKEQQNYLLQAERQRVMIDGVAALCRHLGPPITQISAALYRLNENAPTPQFGETIADCQKSFETLQSLLHRMQRTVLYRSEPVTEQLSSEETPEA